MEHPKVRRNTKPKRKPVEHIELWNIGQIKHADIRFGDLTVLVGPQATGKSIFLQLLKLHVDTPAIQAELRRFNIDWRGKPEDFFDLYFGEGMSGIWTADSKLEVDEQTIPADTYAASMKNRSKDEHLFFIPAQRVMSLRDGLTRPFADYRYGDPFALREFSEKLHQLVQNEFSRDPALFPKGNRLNAALREPIAQHIFGDFQLRTDAKKLQKQIVLMPPNADKPLPYLVWSAGQREFVPLLLGLYWLMPPSRTPLREHLEWVVIEEPEMGLHPDAISVVMMLVLELLLRGYRVCLSTHSPHVLDVVWALQFMKTHDGMLKDVLRLFELRSRHRSRDLAEAALTKNYRAYYFGRDGEVHDISDLDPGSPRAVESGWGGLSGFSSHVGDVVATVASRFQNKGTK